MTFPLTNYFNDLDDLGYMVDAHESSDDLVAEQVVNSLSNSCQEPNEVTVKLFANRFTEDATSRSDRGDAKSGLRMLGLILGRLEKDGSSRRIRTFLKKALVSAAIQKFIEHWPKFSNRLRPDDTDPVLLSEYIGTLTKLNFITYRELGALIAYVTRWAKDGLELACAADLFRIYNSFDNFRKDHLLALEILSTLKANCRHVSHGRRDQEKIFCGLIYNALLLMETASQS